MRYPICCALLLISLSLPVTVQAQDQRTPFEGRAEINVRAGTERSILMNEFWAPLAQDTQAGSVVYGDLRLMGDDVENREFNLGVGYRKLVIDAPLLGDGVAGIHGWIDRRVTDRGSRFNQLTTGVEWLGRVMDITANAYVPLNKEHTLQNTAGGATNPFLSGTGIFYTEVGGRQVVEEAQTGFDLELGLNVGGLIDNFTDTTRIYAGAYHFSGERSESVTGWRARIASDITPDFQIGARFQQDDARGSQGFLEATIRFPFGNKKSFKRDNLYARLDQSPERDIDIVTGTASQVTADAVRPVLNAKSGAAQRVIYVDNTAAGGGDGSLATPYNSLAVAQAALLDNDILYIARGTGTTANMNAGLNVMRNNVQVIGEGSAFVFDGARLSTGTGSSALSGTVLRAANMNPVLGNAALNSDVITLSGTDIFLTGISINSAARHGVYALANGGATLNNIVIDNVIISNATQDGIHIEATGAGSTIDAVVRDTSVDSSKNGYRFYAQNDASVTGAMINSIGFSNVQHGAIIYDDSIAGSVNVDLGGGGRSTGKNSLYGNTLEDLALDIDGGTLFAQNNWWGQATGPDQDNPTIGGRPQIYYGAPLDDGLSAHWTFDAEWTTNTTAYDRSGNNRNGTLSGGLDLTDQVTGTTRREGLTLNGTSDYLTIGASSLYLPGVDSPITILTTFNPTTIPAAVHDSRLVNLLGSAAGSRLAQAVGSTNHLTYYTPAVTSQTFNDNTLTLGTSYQGVIAYDGVNITGYQNAVADSNVQAVNMGAGHATTATIGSFLGTSLFFRGTLEDVRIYNRALSAGEVAELYRMNTTSAVNFTGFLAAAP